MSSKLVPFGQAPLGKGEKPAALSDGTDGSVKDPAEEIHKPVEVVNRGGTVSDEGWSLHVTGVELGSVVHLEHVIRQLLQGGEVIGTNEAVRIKILFHPRVAPVDGNGVHMKRIDQFFCGPAGAVAIFKRDVEAVLANPIDLPLVTVFLRNAKPGVVQGRSGGIDLSSAIQDVEKVLSFLGGTVGISAKEGTEMGLCGSDLFRVCDRGSDHRLELLIEGVNREIVGPRVVDLMGNDSVVALVPVGTIEFLAPVDLDPVLQAVLVPDVSIDHKLCWVVPDNIKMGSQEICKETAPTRVQVAKRQRNGGFFHLKNCRARRVRSVRGLRKET